jgi:hypothetical protein
MGLCDDVDARSFDDADLDDGDDVNVDCLTQILRMMSMSIA